MVLEYTQDTTPRHPAVRDALQETERLFREKGLPALAFGYDRAYGQRLRRVTQVLVLVGSAVQLLASLLVWLDVISNRYWLWAFAVQALGIGCTFMHAHLVERGPEYYTEEVLSAEGSPSALVRARPWLTLAAVVSLYLFSDTVLDGTAASIVAGGAIGLGFIALQSWLGGLLTVGLHVARSLLKGFLPSLRIVTVETPLLFPTLLIIFVTDDAWRTFGQLEGWRYDLAICSLLVLAFLVLRVRMRAARERVFVLATTASDKQVADLLRGTPLRDVSRTRVKKGDVLIPHWARANVGLVVLTTATLRLVLIGLATATALLLFGVVVLDTKATVDILEVVPPETVAYYNLDLGIVTISISEPLVRLSLMLGALASLYFAIQAQETNVRHVGKASGFVADELRTAAIMLVLFTHYVAMHRSLAEEAPSPQSSV